MRLKSTLDQWLTLYEIDRAGSFQAAAIVLNKSHTTLIYSVKKLESQLGIILIEVQGRRAVLTEDGKSLLRRATTMLEQARELENISQQLSKGFESEITIAVDHLCDLAWLYKPMEQYVNINGATSVQVVETSLTKTTDMVINERADISIINLPVTNYSAEAFGVITMVPIVAVTHPLALKNIVSLAEISTLPQIVIRDLGYEPTKKHQQDVGWLKSRQRITVDNFAHAFQAVEQGVGFCRIPEHMVRDRNKTQVVVLEVEHAQKYQVPMHLTLPKGAKTGPAAKAFYDILLQSASHRRKQYS
ncbi:LysR family transcriptional regulator [Photobacterium sp. NCIMB 13483]|uniref:HTH-type transcriptional regulator CynR n=1 Tax=Photobacterium piscicola TaxID=1378299 RepID=A0A1T5HXF2_9GAMM|nr:MULTISPECIES: LysR family transcriptional regulator [Photobacterium]PST85338.1 LysR family transcriptional regulator [Photobacterium sp. NCIMB 13483]SKC31488.1 HTH-type transcriptional regulator CynR [Photobacterium piscicola]